MATWTLGVGNPYDGMVDSGPVELPGFRCAAWRSRCDAHHGKYCLRQWAMYYACLRLLARRIRKHIASLATSLRGCVPDHSKTVLRGAAGEFATRMGLARQYLSCGNPPFQPFITVSAVSGDLTDKQVDNPATP